MSNDAILIKMRHARVPAHAYTQTLRSMGLHGISTAVRDGSFRSGVAGLKSFYFTGKRSAMACSVLAKELVLAGAKVYCTTAIEIATFYATEDRLSATRDGYLVIPGFADALAGVTATSSLTVQYALLEHISRGGAVAVGAGNGETTALLPEFVDALTIFEYVEAK